MPVSDFQLVQARQIGEPKFRAFAESVWGEGGWDHARGAWWMRSCHVQAAAATESATGRMAGLCIAIPSVWALPDGRVAKAVSICGWYVAPEFNGKGLGRMLVRHFESGTTCMNALSISDAAVHNFSKLGWNGPFSTHLLLLPLPFAHGGRRVLGSFSLASWNVVGQHLPENLVKALDQIDREKPLGQLRRQRRASEWRAHLGVYPSRRLQFHIVLDGPRPVGYFVIRSTDAEAGHWYRLARLHYVSDLVINACDPGLLRFLIQGIAAVAPISAGGLLLCTSSRTIASAAHAAGWINDQSWPLGQKLAAKAPRYMVGGEFKTYEGKDFWLTFVDSDLDLNI
jgi:hypothetical protein